MERLERPPPVGEASATATQDDGGNANSGDPIADSMLVRIAALCDAGVDGRDCCLLRPQVLPWHCRSR
eukprot:scaffold808_cov370-Prasinococcus_capsulatus_cf.AAC.5